MKLILTHGVSACGKSTFAKNYQETHSEEVVIIERDQIRERLAPGYWKKTPDKGFEKLVTTEQLRLINQAYELGVDTVIISDTNLAGLLEAQLEVLEIYPKLQIEHQWFDSESFSIDLCIERNRNREKTIPESVIFRQWRDYVRLRGTTDYFSFDTSKKPVLFISDVHGLYGKLATVVNEYCEDYDIVLAGDLNDQRFSELEENFSENVSAMATLKYVFEACNQQRLGHQPLVHLLHSNHQETLLNLLLGTRRKLSSGLQHTAAELTWYGLNIEFDEARTAQEADEDTLWIKGSTYEDLDYRYDPTLTELMCFLGTRPSCLAMTHNGQQWRFAHAFVPEEQEVFQPFPKNYKPYIYGDSKKKIEDSGKQWWESMDYKPYFRACCGHHHTLYFGDWHIVCDPPSEYELGLVFFEDGMEPYLKVI